MRIVVYALHSAIWQHAFPEAVLFDAISKAGHEIIYVGCGEILRPFCIAMSARGLRYGSDEAQCKKICRICKQQHQLLTDRLSLSGPLLRDLVTEQDQTDVEELLQTVERNNYLELTYRGIDVGRLSTYEFLLNNKKNNLVVEEKLWPEMRHQLRNSLLSIVATDRIIEKYSPDCFIYYNTFYSINHVSARYAETKNIAHYLLHAGFNQAHRLSSLHLSQGYSYNYITRHPRWDQTKHKPCSSAEMELVGDHILALLNASSVFVYSSPKAQEHVDIRAKFAIQPDQKILVATMSCHDERYASVTIGAMPPDGDLLFPTQVDWISALFEYIEKHPDTFLIVRVHPREFPNKREGVTSEYALKLIDLFAKHPRNCHINWPSEAVSLYDIAQYADVFLNSRSTTGLEMNMLGLPVVLYSPDQMYAYPPALNFCADEKDDYFEKITQAISHGWDISYARHAFRWGVFQYANCVVDISDFYDPKPAKSKNIVSKAVNWLARKISPYAAQKRDIANLPPQIAATERIDRLLRSRRPTLMDSDPLDATDYSLEQETQGLKKQFQKIYNDIYNNKSSRTPLQNNIIKFLES